jgi:hypothetical protein
MMHALRTAVLIAVAVCSATATGALSVGDRARAYAWI